MRRLLILPLLTGLAFAAFAPVAARADICETDADLCQCYYVDVSVPPYDPGVRVCPFGG